MSYCHGGNQTVSHAADGSAAAPTRTVDLGGGAKIPGCIEGERRQTINETFELRVCGVVAGTGEDLHGDGLTHRDVVGMVGQQPPHLKRRRGSAPAEVFDPRGRVDKDHAMSSGPLVRTASRSPSQPMPSRPLRKSGVSGSPANRRNAKSTASFLVVRPNRRITFSTRPSSNSIFVRVIHQAYTSHTPIDGGSTP